MRMKFRKVSMTGLLCALVTLFGLRADAETEAEGVLILVNSNDSSSVRLGLHYAEARAIPKQNLISLPMPMEETISVQTYVEKIANPLLNAVMEEGFVDGVLATQKDKYGRQRLALVQHSISYLVLMRGVPLRIENAPELLMEQDDALPAQLRITRGSVDSELNLLLGPPGLSMAGLIPNPYFMNPNAGSLDAQRVIFVSRLDGPSEADVKSMIDRTLEAESRGLMGRAYFDIGGPHKKGDEWIRNAYGFAVAADFDAEIEITQEEIGYSRRLDAPAIYMGWYQRNAYGPWLDREWNVPPGAIGFHLHSFSATTVRSVKSAWLGPLVHQGYCAMVGNVYEPYLDYTHRPNVLLETLLQGVNFAQAATWSIPFFSWQGVAIGDPLYRPFKVSLESQVAMEDRGAYGAYAVIRELNRLKKSEGVAAALSFARREFVKHPSLPVSLRLAELFIANEQPDKAKESLSFITYLSNFAKDEWVLVKEIADLLYQLGAGEESIGLYTKLLKMPDLDRKLKMALLEDGEAIANELGKYSEQSDWFLKLNALRSEGTK